MTDTLYVARLKTECEGLEDQPQGFTVGYHHYVQQ